MELEVQVHNLMPICKKYTCTLGTGWNAWVNSIDDKIKRSKRDTMGTILGGVGTGLGAMNVIDQEIIATKLGTVGTELETLKHPLGESLNQLSTIQHKVTNILP